MNGFQVMQDVFSNTLGAIVLLVAIFVAVYFLLKSGLEK